ncbi:uncharacterized protein LOC129913751 [Episyrphus balteatus]|uniref:uncharacterized protein LOC129913751 n=1 Tax=Episyrphus balteatus TaxID=286459 RepID=UPI0024868169|nr:uncharacterized protein LOC129913751 [Episyrphus balteatus]XP_055848552.1 uncharacterized protein LOC129913751 [Episyrphus balteatus]
MENRFESGIFSEASSYFISDSSDEDSDDCEDLPTSKAPENEVSASEEVNLHYMLMKRENTGHFSGNRRSKQVKRAFNKVPTRLGFCLKDIVPYCYLQGHMFMGLTACGQYLLSYKVCCNESSNANASYFNIGYKYTLYFWIYRPHQPLRRFFKSCLFDDHGADNLKSVTMAQWVTNPRVLIVHGAAENENEESYLTYVKVPKLGCLDCKKLREFDEDGFSRCDALCIKCNLTIHTKYSTTESDPKFNPHINLICPDRVIIIANGFIHMLHVDLEATPNNNHPPQSMAVAAMVRCTPPHEVHQPIVETKKPTIAFPRQTPVAEETIGCDNTNNIVARIIADFSDIENEAQTSSGSGEKTAHRTGDTVKTKNFDELIFTCGLSSGAGSSKNSKSQTTSSTTAGGSSQTKVSLVNHQGKRNHRIVTKSYRNGITTVDLQSASTSSSDKASAYEFSEDNEKCEKIGTFRKRRLADKKYEFSEDNSENIIPFTKIRMTSQQMLPGSAANRLHRATSHFHSPCVSPPSTSASLSIENNNSASVHHYHGFRSPCGSPVGNTMIRSPGHLFQQQKSPPSSTSQQMLNFKPLTTISPLQLSMAKRNHYEIGNMSPTTVPFLSPRRDEPKVLEVPLQGGFGQEKPTCTKKFKRRFVEEDDAASVITSEEDDCISPGYHTSLPMEVHGSCYSDMQMISQMSYEKLRCVSVVITQHSFDLETFTYYVISNLCQKNNKIYDVFYDWACELINVCPRSNLISCVLMAHFTARDQLPTTCNNCLNCSRNIDCVFHRKQFECRILFTWNMELGDWDVLDYGELHEFNRTGQPYDSGSTKSSSKSFGGGLSQTAKSLAQDLAASLDKLQDFSSNLRVWDSNVSKSKSCLTDLDNVIEFFLKRPRFSE